MLDNRLSSFVNPGNVLWLRIRLNFQIHSLNNRLGNYVHTATFIKHHFIALVIMFDVGMKHTTPTPISLLVR